jgi:hypothetical protein
MPGDQKIKQGLLVDLVARPDIVNVCKKRKPLGLGKLHQRRSLGPRQRRG